MFSEEPETLRLIHEDSNGRNLLHILAFCSYTLSYPTSNGGHIIKIETYVLHSVADPFEHDYSSSRIVSSEFLSRVPRGRGILT